MAEHDDVLPLDAAPETDRAPRPSGRKRLLVLGATAALLVGAIALVQQRGQGDDDDPDPDPDEVQVDLEPTVLQLLGPRDGNESIGLPIMVEPSTGLVDGQTVTATSGGFVPGEGVGIVQCADAALDEPGDAIDLCNISGYTSLQASTDGMASGAYRVVRTLTTPRSGTVDCATEVRRCFIAMGAINDYDRSGGFELEFALESPPPSDAPLPAVVGPPSASAVPSVELSDGDVVQLTASGLVEGERLEASLCSVDPDVCWPLVGPEPAAEDPLGITVTAGGYVNVPLQVWRFLPGGLPGTYVDCAISQCRIHLTGGTVPDPLVLGFADDGAPPTGPVLRVTPSEDVLPGDPITIAGAGFLADSAVLLELCAQSVADPTLAPDCVPVQETELQADGEGVFSIEATVPSLDGDPPETSVPCDDASSTTSSPCDPQEQPAGAPQCDGDAITCEIRATLSGALGYGRPAFAPAPVTVTFRAE